MHFSFSPLSLCKTTGYLTTGQSLRRTTMLKLYLQNKCGKNSTASQKWLQDKERNFQKCSQPCSKKAEGDSVSRFSYTLDQPCQVSCPSLCQTSKLVAFDFFKMILLQKHEHIFLDTVKPADGIFPNSTFNVNWLSNAIHLICIYLKGSLDLP